MSWIITGAQKVNWDPSLISTALWLDAADASTVQTTSGLVDQINDKSGNGRDFTATSTARPTYTTSGQNGKNVLTFNGTSNFLSRANYVYGATHSLFVVFKYTGAPTITTSTALFSLTHSTTNLNTGIKGGNHAGVIANERLGYYSFVEGFAKTDADINATTPLLLSFAINGGQANAIRKLNGVADFATTNGSAVPTAIEAIGAFLPGPSTFFTGLFCELIIAPSFLPATDIEKTEGYLAHKWGLTANLPSNHPYKSNPPAP